MSSLPLLSPFLPSTPLGSIDLIHKGLTTNRTMYCGMGGILDSQREVRVAGKHEPWPSGLSSELSSMPIGKSKALRRGGTLLSAHTEQVG